MAETQRYREGVLVLLMSLAYATRKNQDEETPERMEIDIQKMDECIKAIERSSFLGENDCMKLPKRMDMMNMLADIARRICK